MSTQNSGFTQATAAATYSQTKPAYDDWCEKFLALVGKTAADAPTGGSGAKLTKAFASLADKERYKRLFDFLLEKCHRDQGGLLVRVVTGFSVGLRHANDPEELRGSLLNHLFNVIDKATLSTQNGAAVADLLKLFVSDSSKDRLEKLHATVHGHFVSGSYVSRRALEALVVVIDGIRAKDDHQSSGNGSALRTVLTTLYDQSTEASVKQVASLIRELNAEVVLVEYIDSMFRQGHDPGPITPLVWAKVASSLSVLNEQAFLTTFDRIVQHWRPMPTDQLATYETGFKTLQTLLEGRPTLVAQLVRHLRAQHFRIWTNQFKAVSLLVLGSIDRYANEVQGILAKTLTELWRIDALAQRNLWIRTVIASDNAPCMRETVIGLTALMKASTQWFTLVGSTLEHVSMSLMFAPVNGKKLQLANGRLKDTGGVGFLGRYIFIEVALRNQEGIGGQLRRLVNAVLASASNVTVAYLLVDVLLEVSRRCAPILWNATEAFTELVDCIWHLPDCIGVTLIRAILPVLKYKPELQAHLLDQLKVELLRPASAPIAIPTLLLLWKSVVQHPSVEHNAQMKLSQSFATFSSYTAATALDSRRQQQLMAIEIAAIVKRSLGQSTTAKCLLSRGLVDICSKVPYFSVQALDMLLPQLTSIPALAVENFVDAAKDGVRTKIPVAQMVNAVSMLLRIVIENAGNDIAAHTLAYEAEQVIEGILHEVATKSLTDLVNDESEDASAPYASARRIHAFGRIVLVLHDALIAHLWRIADGEFTFTQAELLQKLLTTRSELEKFMTVSKPGKSKTAKGAATVKLARDEPHGDIVELEAMLRFLISEDFSETNQHLAQLRVGKLLPWTLTRIHELLINVDPHALSGVSPQQCYASLAKSLLHFLLGDDHVDGSLREIKQYQPIKSIALACYARVVKYLMARYGRSSEAALKALLNCFVDLDFGQVRTQTSQNVSQGQPAAPCDSSEWRTTLTRHFYAYGSAMLGSLMSPVTVSEFRDQNSGDELQKQVLTLVDLCGVIAEETPLSTDHTLKTFYQIIIRRAQSCPLGDGKVLSELLKLTFGLLAGSSGGDWTTAMLERILDQVVQVAPGAEDNAAKWNSVNEASKDSVFDQLLQFVERYLGNVHLALRIKLKLETTLGDDFLMKICISLRRFSDIVVRAVEFGVQNDCLLDRVAVVLTNLFDIVSEMLKQVERASKVSGSRSTVDWTCVDALESILRDCVIPVRTLTAHSAMGSWTEAAAVLRLRRKAKQVRLQERVYVAHAKSAERLVVAALLVGKRFERDGFDLQELPLFRCFLIDMAAAVERLQGDADNGDDGAQEDGGESDGDVADENEAPQSKRRRIHGE